MALMQSRHKLACYPASIGATGSVFLVSRALCRGDAPPVWQRLNRHGRGMACHRRDAAGVCIPLGGKVAELGNSPHTKR
jgi:hypothetical protein